jgi:hypothetical protein
MRIPPFQSDSWVVGLRGKFKQVHKRPDSILVVFDSRKFICITFFTTPDTKSVYIPFKVTILWNFWHLHILDVGTLKFPVLCIAEATPTCYVIRIPFHQFET